MPLLELALELFRLLLVKLLGVLYVDVGLLDNLQDTRLGLCYCLLFQNTDSLFLPLYSTLFLQRHKRLLIVLHLSLVPLCLVPQQLLHLLLLCTVLLTLLVKLTLFLNQLLNFLQILLDLLFFFALFLLQCRLMVNIHSLDNFFCFDLLLLSSALQIMLVACQLKDLPAIKVYVFLNICNCLLFLFYLLEFLL